MPCVMQTLRQGTSPPGCPTVGKTSISPAQIFLTPGPCPPGEADDLQKGCNPSPPRAGWTCPLPPLTSIRVTSALSQKTTLFCVPQPTWPQDSLGVQHHGLDRLHTVCEGLSGPHWSALGQGLLGLRSLTWMPGPPSSQAGQWGEVTHTQDARPCLDRIQDILVPRRLSGRGEMLDRHSGRGEVGARGMWGWAWPPAGPLLRTAFPAHPSPSLPLLLGCGPGGESCPVPFLQPADHAGSS